MDSSDDEFDAIDEEALLLAASEPDILQSDEQPSPASSRPLKKRRLNPISSNNAQAESKRNVTSSNSYSDDNGSDGFDPPLPPNRRKSCSADFSFEDQGGGRKKPEKPKRRIAIPKDAELPPDEFVTQLTQIPSSPSRIRGPRWKKITPPPVPVQPQGQRFERVEDSPNVEDLLRGPNSNLNNPLEKTPRSNGNQLGYVGESLFVSQSSMNENDQAPIIRDLPLSDDVLMVLDGLPSDAFDSSPTWSPKAAQNQPILISSQPARSNARPTASNGPPKNLRQTTLFGTTAQHAGLSTQSREKHNWPLISKKETPTHHKLNDDALRTWVYPMNVGTFRDYQFNIVARGLFHNLLVALPTGLGKTFIAATIMLNWFRWTKDAQIVFVAPTKPLVSQQVEACFQTVGIPRSQTSMLTGTISPGIRAEEWQSKRVFFMTPQTLINDLKTGICDPKRIVLLVVDEAHRATGAFSYVEVVKFLRRFNTSFRVLALTATPGSSVETVQEVIDSLDISRTEIRTEESLDIRSFVHSKNVDLQIFDYTEEMESIMDLCSRAIKPILTQLNSQNAYWAKDPMTLTAFGLHQARGQWASSGAGRNAGWNVKGPVMAMFSTLASIAHSIELLKYHGMVPFYHTMVTLQNNTSKGDKGDKYKKQIINNEHFKKMMSQLSAWTSDPEFIGHPKLEYVRSIILNHFMDAGEGRGAADGRPPSETRIMVFVHYRDSAEEVVRVLKKHEPMIRPHIFNGQAGSKGSEGMNQKTQLATLEDFKKGKFNTLVATSIGEEGLDIGEVDLILCYDSSSSPIRMLQRFGRTGRKREGNVFLLLMRGKEEESYIKAKDNYQKMQQLIASGSMFTYHDDRSPRIIPKDVQPVADKRVIEIPVENSQLELPEPKKRGRPPKRPPKKFHMPDKVETGFVKASRVNRRHAESQSDTDNDSEDAPNPPSHYKRVPSPSPEAAEIPRLEDVLLNPTQDRELMRKYANLRDAPSQLIEPPRLDGYPELLRKLQPTKLVKHGRLAKEWTRTFMMIHAMQADCAERFQDNLKMEDLVGDPFDESHGEEWNVPVRSRQSDGTSVSTSKKKSRTTSRNQIFVASQTSSAGDNEGHDSSANLMQDPPARKVEQPFYVSQKSQDGVGDDEELPDLDDLLNSKKGTQVATKETFVSAKPRQRARRFLVDDDSDD
jgi:ATP-dependent DNA helicase MPH1